METFGARCLCAPACTAEASTGAAARPTTRSRCVMLLLRACLVACEGAGLCLFFPMPSLPPCMLQGCALLVLWVSQTARTLMRALTASCTLVWARSNAAFLDCSRRSAYGIGYGESRIAPQRTSWPLPALWPGGQEIENIEREGCSSRGREPSASLTSLSCAWANSPSLFDSLRGATEARSESERIRPRRCPRQDSVQECWSLRRARAPFPR